MAVAIAGTVGALNAQDEAKTVGRENDEARLAALDAEAFDARSFMALVESSERVVPELIAIAVDPRHQAQGVGKRLLLHALEFARAWQQTTGVRSVQLNVADTNRRALEFFTRTGFVVLDPNDGTYPRGQRSIRMVRPLEPIAEAEADPDPAREEPGSGDRDP